MSANNGTVILDLKKLRGGKRTEVNDPLGRIIADPNFMINIGKYTDSAGIGHVSVSFTDPQLENGARRVYLIPKAGALLLAEGLRKVAGEVPV